MAFDHWSLKARGDIINAYEKSSDHADNLIIIVSENGLKDSMSGVDSVRDKDLDG